MSTSVASSPFREVTNQIHFVEKVTVKGTHIKFDDEGNTEVVMQREGIVYH